jgi:transglutaminase-like putative cysteine protease
MKKPTMLFLSFLMAVGAGPSYAQQGQNGQPPKWGEIPPEHLQMDHYAPDSSAAVVILADYGNVFFENDLDLAFERHTRIKILTEAGYDWGSVTVVYHADDRTQRVKDIKGRTYYAEEGGRVETHEMEKGSVFDEDVDGVWRRVRFTLPALQPGSVIEYRYKVVSTNARYFPDWAFQKSEPVLWSEYRAEIPEILRYVSVYQGELEPDVAEQSSHTRTMHWTIDMSSDYATGRAQRMANASTQVKSIRHRWVMRDVPALRSEPYMTTPEDYRAKIRFELAEIGRPSAQWVQVTYQGQTAQVPAAQFPVTPVMTTWEQLAEELTESRRFGKQIGRQREVRTQARAIVEGIAEPEQQMQALYDYLRTTIVWTGEHGVYCERDLDDALKARSANSQELALLLVSMLRDVGLEAHPVLISTRSHGQILPLYPLVSQFDAVIVYVEIDGVGYLLDATDPLRPHTLLPYEALNGSGFLVRHPGPAWVTITPADQYRHERVVKAQLDTAGTLSGSIETSDDGYSALANRRALDEAETPEDFVQNTILDDLDGALVDSCTLTNEQAVTEQLETEASFSAPGYAQVMGDFIYFNPTPLGRLTENPLRLATRTFPVDLAYPRQQIYTVSLKLPEGYAVQETPQDVSILLPEGGQYQRLIAVRGDTLVTQSEFTMSQSIFEPECYERLRSFFEQIVAAEAEQVVLKRVTESADTVDGAAER